MRMNMKNAIKKIWFSLYKSGRVVLLDYPVRPAACYTREENHPQQKLFNLIAAGKLNYQRFLQDTLKYKEAFSTIAEDRLVKNGIDPGWNNGYLPGLDMIMLYSLLAQMKPKRYIEIGSGTSTKVAYKSRKENSLGFEIISIDPAPRKNILDVADKMHTCEIQKTDAEIFRVLEENDVVFFDGTHMLYPNSDVMWFFLEILPVLKKGVIVHLHDIYLPYDYPAFMLDRYYNEQYVLGALLLNNPGKYEMLCPNYFIYSEKDMLSILDPIWQLEALRNVEQHGGSFWLKVLS